MNSNLKSNLSIFLIIILIVIIALFIFYFNYNKVVLAKANIEKFNYDYLLYNTVDVDGVDIASLINKAISNNEKYELDKNDKGYYILDNEYSIEIYLKLSDNGNIYLMENLFQNDLKKFVEYFGNMKFDCEEVTYHESTGRIATMLFNVQNY